MSNASKFRKKAVEYEQLKQFDRAVASYVRAIEENENANEEVDVALFNKVGDLTLRQGRVTEAVTYYERAVEHYVSNNLFDNAIALCNKILRNAPGRSNVYFTLGRICGRKGLRSDATRNFLAYATRMQQEGRVDEGMRALAEVADLMPELTEIGRLVEEHAARAGISLAPRRRATPPRTPAQPSGTDATRSFGMSRDLVFLEIDYEAAQQARAKTPPPQRDNEETSTSAASHSTAELTPAHVAVASVESAAASGVATTQAAIVHTSTPTPTAQLAATSGRLEDLMIYDPNERSAAHVDVIGGDETSIVDGASILKPYADVTAPVEALNDLEPTELASAASLQDDPEFVSAGAPEGEDAAVRDEVASGSHATPVVVARMTTLPDFPAVADDAANNEPDAAALDDNAGIYGNVSLEQNIHAFSTRADERAELMVEELVDIEADDFVDASLAVEDSFAVEATVVDDRIDDVVLEEAMVADETLTDVESLETEAASDTIADTFADTIADAMLVEAIIAADELNAVASVEVPVFDDTPDNSDASTEASTDYSVSDDADSGDIVNFALEQELNLLAPTPRLDGFTPDDEPLVVEDLDTRHVTADSLSVEAEEERIDAMLEVESDAVLPVADLQAEEFEPVNNELAAARFARIESETLPPLADEYDQEHELPPLSVAEFEAKHVSPELVFIDVDITSATGELELLPIDLDVDMLGDLFIDSDVPTAIAAAEATLVASSRCAELQGASNADPDNFVLRRRLAEALFESGDREAAINELGAALAIAELAENLPDAADIADELVGVAADLVAHHQKRLELAIRIGDQTRLSSAYLDFADSLVRQGEEIRARAVYARVLEIDPWDDRARTALGDAAPPPPAKPATPGSDDSHVNLADWLRDDDEPASTRLRMREPDISGDEQDDFNALLRHFKEGVARSLGEDDHESHYDLGVAYKGMGLLDDAIGEFQMALRSRSNRLAAYEALGQCFIEQQSYKVAVTVLSRALHEPAIEDEQRVGVLYLLGYSCEVLQRFDEARGYFQRVYATDIHFRDVAQRLAALDRTVR